MEAAVPVEMLPRDARARLLAFVGERRRVSVVRAGAGTPFFASGRPVVSTPLPDLDGYRSVVRFASTADELVDELEAGRRESSMCRARRASIARANSWPAREREWGQVLRRAGVS